MEEGISFVGIDMQETGKRIRTLRRQCGLTVEQVSEVVGTSPQSVYKWQEGKCLPTLDNMAILSQLFQTPINDILILNHSDWEEEWER